MNESFLPVLIHYFHVKIDGIDICFGLLNNGDLILMSSGTKPTYNKVVGIRTSVIVSRENFSYVGPVTHTGINTAEEIAQPEWFEITLLAFALNRL